MTEKWGFKQLCSTWMKLAVSLLPQSSNQECDVVIQDRNHIRH